MTVDELAIRLEGVGKRYWKLEEQAMLLRSLLPFARPKRSELWALRKIDLRVAQGETVGVLGRNGAGKTSLLRLLAGVSQPTEGRVRVVGRTAPLIGVGVGFQREMSGRENVYVNGMLLGLNRQEIDERFSDIVSFAELEDFIDTPVKFYSSGMYMRLGFAVAIHVQPDVLLVDEVLAVGDLAFQLKCFDRMRAIQGSGTTIVIVSHSMHAIRLLCPRAVVLRYGEMVFDGDVEGAITRHHELLTLDEGQDRSAAAGMVEGPSAVSALSTELVGDGARSVGASSDLPIRFRIRLAFHIRIDSPQVTFDILAEDGTLAYEIRSVVGRSYRVFSEGDTADVDVEIVPRLGGGTYRVVTSVMSSDLRTLYYRDPVGTLFYVTPVLGSSGIAALDATIRIDGVVMSDYAPVMLGRRSTPAGSEDVAGGDAGLT